MTVVRTQIDLPVAGDEGRSRARHPRGASRAAGIETRVATIETKLAAIKSRVATIKSKYATIREEPGGRTGTPKNRDTQ